MLLQKILQVLPVSECAGGERLEETPSPQMLRNSAMNFNISSVELSTAKHKHLESSSQTIIKS